METTPYRPVNQILEILLERIHSILEGDLRGLYLGGSLAWGDFTPGISDIDLLAAIATVINDQKLQALSEMHAQIAALHPEWDDRIEVCYISTEALAHVLTRSSMMVNISPGEPIHRLASTPEWIIKWSPMREASLALYGPPASEWIEPISQAVFIACVKRHAMLWSDWIQDYPRNAFALSYARLTMCRSLYTCTFGKRVSKQRAGIWVQTTYPQFARMIQEALSWREGPRSSPPDECAYGETVLFIRQVQDIMIVGR